ncbi:putative copper homeostasis (lipo)protein LpqS [Mycobacterium avium]
MMSRPWAARPSSGRVLLVGRTTATALRACPRSVMSASPPDALLSRHRMKSDGCRASQSHAVIAMMAIAVPLAMLLGIMAPCGLARSDSLPLHQPRSVLKLPGAEHLGSVSQPDAVNGPSNACTQTFPDAVLPQSPASAVAMLGAVTVVVTVAGWRMPRVAPAERDPPRGPVAFPTGQELLTRFCLSRR